MSVRQSRLPDPDCEQENEGPNAGSFEISAVHAAIGVVPGNVLPGTLRKSKSRDSRDGRETTQAKPGRELCLCCPCYPWFSDFCRAGSWGKVRLPGMKTRKMDEALADSSSAEAHQLMDLLQAMARIMGFSNAALARRANVSLASLMRYFKGEAEPRLDFVLAVVRAMGLEVREFFEIAYPTLAAPTAARQKIGQMLGPVRLAKAPEISPLPEPDPAPEVPVQREEVEKMLEDFRKDLLRDLREMLDGKSS